MTSTEQIRGSARFRRYVPWQGPATRRDLALMGAILGVVGLGLVIRPLKPFLVAEHPMLLEFVSGDLLATGAGAAFARIGEAPLWLVVVAGAAGMVKFDWLAWWAGRHWGAGIIRIFTASERAQRYAARATEWNPWVVRLAVVIAVLPGIPTAVVYAAAGWARMRPATFLLLDLVGAAQACRSRDGRHIEPRISSPAHPPRRCGNAAATGRPRREPATQPRCAVSQSARSASAARQPWVPRTT